jgi:hypothetical protein
VMASDIGCTVRLDERCYCGAFEFASNGISAKASRAIAWSSNGTR